MVLSRGLTVTDLRGLAPPIQEPPTAQLVYRDTHALLSRAGGWPLDRMSAERPPGPGPAAAGLP